MFFRLKIVTCVFVVLLMIMSSALSFADTITYTYDDLNRLTTMDYGNGTTTTYTYDAAGNRLTMTTTPQGNGEIYGNVVDTDNNPIESAGIRVKGKGINVAMSTTTDAGGLFEFTHLWTDTYVITATKEGYYTVKKTIRLKEGKKKNIHIVMSRISGN